MLRQGRSKQSNDKTSQHQSPGVNARSRLHAGASALALVSVLIAAPETAKAQSVWTGAISNDWTVAGNWTPVGEPAGSATIDTAVPKTVLGVTGPASVSITSLILGGGAGSSGDLTIQNGSHLDIASNTTAVGGSGTGTLTVTGGYPYRAIYYGRCQPRR